MLPSVRRMMRLWISSTLFVWFFALAAPPGRSRFTTFDVGSYSGVASAAINDAGAIVGSYQQGRRRYWGFLRATDGTIAEFRIPRPDRGKGTFPAAIDNRGEIAGYYSVKNGSAVANHGFLRYPGGKFVSFDVPGDAGGTTPKSINESGVVAGDYEDAEGVAHGFLRASNGAIATFDAPGAGTQAYLGTFPNCIDAAGEIAGYEIDNNGVYRGFYRGAGGAIAVFDAPGAGIEGTAAWAINSAGWIAGYYQDGASGVVHGFVRAADGTFTTFDAPGASTTPSQGTFALALNARGDIAGQYLDANGVFHGFLRHPDGGISTLSASGAGSQPPYGTHVDAGGINRQGDIAGFYVDNAGVQHGFLWTGARLKQ